MLLCKDHQLSSTFAVPGLLGVLTRTSRLCKNGHFHIRPFYSYVWNRGWSWPCFDTNLPALSCKSSYSYANQYFSRTISLTKQRRFVSKQGHRQPHIRSKARVLSPPLKMVYSCPLPYPPRLPFTVEDQLMRMQRKVDAIFHCTITTTLYIVIKSLFPLPILRYVTGVIPFPSCKSFHGQGVNLRRLLQM